MTQSAGSPDAPADRHDVIYAVGRIALEFAQLEEALEYCLGTLKSIYPSAPEFRKMARRTPFKRKCDAFGKWGAEYFKKLDLEPAVACDAVVELLRATARHRNRFVHSAAAYHLSDGAHEDMRSLIFRFRSHEDDSIDQVVVTNKMLTDMRAFSNDIYTKIWIMLNLNQQMRQQMVAEAEMDAFARYIPCLLAAAKLREIVIPRIDFIVSRDRVECLVQL